MFYILKKALIRKRAAILAGPLCLALLSICAEGPQNRDKKTGLEVVAPEDVGWSSQKLEEAKAFADKIKSAAVMVLYDGKVFISWGNVATKYSIHSIRKPLLGALYGIYWGRGKINLDATLEDLKIDDIPPALTQEENKATVSDLLKSRSGVYHEAAAESRDMIGARPARGSHPHDTFYYYNNWDFNALGTIFEKMTGAKIFEAFKKEIADPVGMEDFSLDDCRYSYEENKSKHPAYNFRMTARDMARFGLLYLRKGNWNGRQIIPPEWIEKSTKPYSIVSEQMGVGYGYMWNVVLPGQGFSNLVFDGKGGFYHTGVGIHTLAVLPEHKLVYIYRYDTDGEYQDPGEATIQLVSMIMNARQSKCQNTSRPPASKTAAQQSAPTLEPRPESAHYYRTAKPYTRWWWFASEIKKEDIVHQLDWLKAHNFGGVEVAWVYPLNIERYKRFYTWITDEQRKIVEPRQKWQSPEWSEIVAFAKEYADKIGLGMDFTFGTAWPFGDSMVPKEDGAKIYGHPEAKQEVIISWEYPQNGLVIDHMSKGAFERYAARMGAALTKATHTGGKSGLFCDSLEVETKGIWTEGFGDAFKKRYGYTIEPYMDSILAPENAGPRYDYMKLVSEYVIENFYKPFTEASHGLNAFSRIQAHGSPTDLITAYATADVPETEALLFEPNFARIAASAAALAGKKDVTSETFTCAYGFPRDHFKEEQAADLKLIADAVLANGVNHIIWHGTPFNTQSAAHDNEFYASVHVGEKGALSRDLTSFNEYMEKVSGYMDEGRTFSSMAVYIPVEDAWVQGEYPKELQFRWTGTGAYELRYIKPAPETRGYHPLWINGEFLRRAKIENGRLNVGDVSFSSLYVDVDYLDGEALGTILEIAKAGFPVCLKKKPKQPGRDQTPLYKEQLEALAKLPNVSADFKGLAIPKPLVEGRDLPDFWCREKDGEYNIFFAQPLARDLKMPIKYGQSFMDKEMTRRVTLNAGGKSTPLDLVFKPYQSLLVRVDKNGDPSFVDITYVPRPPARTENKISRPGVINPNTGGRKI